MPPKIRTSNAPAGYKPLRPKQSPATIVCSKCKKTFKAKIQIAKEAAYANPVTAYNRPFESRLTTFNERAEIKKELIKISDGYYQHNNTFL